MKPRFAKNTKKNAHSRFKAHHVSFNGKHTLNKERQMRNERIDQDIITKYWNIDE